MSRSLRQRIHAPNGHRLALVGLLWLLPLLEVAAQSGPPKGQSVAPEHCEQNVACRKLLLQARKYSAGGRYEQAVAIFQEALKRTEQRDVRLYVDLGRAYHLWGRISEAVAAYKQYLTSVPPETPGRDIVLRWLSDALMSEGQTDPAAESALRPKPAAPLPVSRPVPSATSPEPPTLAQGPSRTPEPSAPAERAVLQTQPVPAQEPILPPNAPSASRTELTPARCGAETVSANKKLLIAGGTIAGAGLLGLIPSFALYGLNRTPTGLQTMTVGTPNPLLHDTQSEYIAGFVFSGIAGVAGGAIISVAAVRISGTRKALCTAQRS